MKICVTLLVYFVVRRLIKMANCIVKKDGSYQCDGMSYCGGSVYCGSRREHINNHHCEGCISYTRDGLKIRIEGGLLKWL